MLNLVVGMRVKIPPVMTLCEARHWIGDRQWPAAEKECDGVWVISNVNAEKRSTRDYASVRLTRSGVDGPDQSGGNGSLRLYPEEITEEMLLWEDAPPSFQKWLHQGHL